MTARPDDDRQVVLRVTGFGAPTSTARVRRWHRHPLLPPGEPGPSLVILTDTGVDVSVTNAAEAWLRRLEATGQRVDDGSRSWRTLIVLEHYAREHGPDSLAEVYWTDRRRRAAWAPVDDALHELVRP